MKKVNKFLLTLCACLSMTNANSIQKSTAAFISAGIGVSVGSLCYFGANEWDRNSFASSLIGICTAGLFYLIMREMTPEVRFDRGKSLVLQVENGLLFGSHDVRYLNNKDFFEMMHKTYITYDLPYAVAYHDLVSRLNKLKSADCLFKAVVEEGDQYLKQQSKEYLDKVYYLIGNITNALNRIKQKKEFAEQLKIYEERRLAQERLAIEDRKASAKEREAWAKEQQVFIKEREANAKEREVVVKEQQAHVAEWSW